VRPRPGASPAVRILAVALLVLGAALTVVSLFADQLSISSVGGKGGAGFGWTQLMAVIVGLVVLLIGLALLLQPPTGRDVDESLE
jgi:hypothetical protein